MRSYGFPPEHVHTDMVPGIMAMGESLKADQPKGKTKKSRARKALTTAKREIVTPKSEDCNLLRQYQTAKETHPGMLLLFRVGDFHELFGSDAEDAAKLLGLTLTTKDGVPMAGFPHHQLEQYLRRLVKEGKRVAVMEAVPDSPKREATRVVMQAGKSEDVLEVVDELGRAAGD